MTAQIVPLLKEQHKHLRISFNKPYSHVVHEHLLPVVLHEFPQVAAEHPIVFVKNTETGSFQSVALVGLEPGSNLFCKEDQWRANYIPQVVRNYPLMLTPDPSNETQLLVGVDQASERVSSVEGEALFTEQGEESEFLQQRKQQLGDFFDRSRMTKEIVAIFTELELLQPQQLTLHVNGKPSEINGLYLIDEQKLNALPVDTFIEFRDKGFLTAIYAHLISIQQIQRLTRWQSDFESAGSL